MLILQVLSRISLTLAFLSAGMILWDIYGKGHRQKMPIMEVVWPVTALYFGPVALWMYRRQKNTGESAKGIMHDKPMDHEMTMAKEKSKTSQKLQWSSVAISVSHCGAGCTLGDIIAEFSIFALGLTVAGTALPYEYGGDYLLAIIFGLAFQYFVIAPMRGLGVRDGIRAAFKADFLALTAFEVGLFGWMALMSYVFFPAPNQIHPSSTVYWFMMQIGMMLGFATSWPANVWLLRRGIKEIM